MDYPGKIVIFAFTMRQKARSILHLLLGALLGWLGFSSCEGIAGIGGGLCMYGEPTVRFKASGTVTDTKGQGISGIRVAVRAHRHYENTPGVIYDRNDWYDDDTLYTDASGKYELSRTLISFTPPDDVTIVFEDIDGNENGGTFAPATATPKIRQVEKGDKSWYGGGFAVEADARLKKQ